MKINLISLNYSENETKPNKNFWGVTELYLNEFNLIVGKNSAGKTRTTRVIYALSNMISRKSPISDGHFNVKFEVFEGKEKKNLEYELNIEDRKVLKEVIKFDNKIVLDRNGKTTIYSYKTKEETEIDPPTDALVLSARRDQVEFPFFEHLVYWATNIVAYKFGNTSPDFIEVPTQGLQQNNILPSLHVLPTVFDKLDEKTVKSILEDFNSIGYEVSEAKTDYVPGNSLNIKMLQIKEKHFKDFIIQANISQGMFRAFALLSIIQYHIDNGTDLTIIVDDFCEGLDYERSEKLTKLLYKKVENKKIQFIATTNDMTLMNAIDLEHWNILRRQQGQVTAYNYSNSKDKFDEFKLSGLANFDIFSSNLLSKLERSQ